MKRRRTILLLVLYLLVFAFTIAMEYFSIMNPGRRLLVNGSTFLMALVSGVLFWLIYRGDRQREDTKEKAVERKKVVEGNKRVEGNKGAEGGKGKVAGEVDEAGTDGLEAAEADKLDSGEGLGSKTQPQMDEHRQTVMEKSEKTQEDVLFDKGKYLAFANSHQLTRREAEIGLLVMNGYSNMQIAETLFIAETTVKKHLSHIYEKAGISGRKEFRQSVNAWNNTGGD